MTFEEYAVQAGLTALYPQRGANLVYPTLGLSGEAGEVSEKVKKIIRDRDGILDEEQRMAIAKELGDVLWYVAAMAHEIDVSLPVIARMNVAKLHGRAVRGTIQGSGDDR